MVSDAMRRYAAEIFRLQEEHEYVSLAELAEHASSSPQAVARMVQRLKAQGYAEHQLYRGVRLTDRGVTIAMPALRRHRIMEVFLVQVMGFGWHEVHPISAKLDTGMNQELENRMDEMTGFPRRCPHGEPIPDRNGVLPVVHDASLVEVNPGGPVTLSRVRTHDDEWLQYLGEMKLFPGTRFELLSIAPFHGPVRIRKEREELVFGYNLAEVLFVEKN